MAVLGTYTEGGLEFAHVRVELLLLTCQNETDRSPTKKQDKKNECDPLLACPPTARARTRILRSTHLEAGNGPHGLVQKLGVISERGHQLGLVPQHAQRGGRGRRGKGRRSGGVAVPRRG